MLAVADTGVGIDPDTLNDIFDPFFTTKPRGKGMGLGLATVYGIVHRNGGGIRVESKPGRGTRFMVYFPRAENVPAPVERPPEAAVDAGGTETILVVEDETPVRTIVRRILETRGYDVIAAGSVQEAWTVLTDADRDAIDLLITDIVLPDGTGRELARRAVRDRPGMGIIFCSGYDPDEVAADTSREVFLPKPFDRETLARTVRAVLDQPDVGGAAVVDPT